MKMSFCSHLKAHGFWWRLFGCNTPPGPEPMPPVEHITVNLCSVSDLLAGDRCRSRYVKTFVLGQQPTDFCAIVGLHPYQMSVCDIPVHEVGVNLIWSGFMLGGLSMYDTEIWKEADLPLYLDAIAEDGCNAHRDVWCFFDGANEVWRSYVPWVGNDYAVPNEEYYAVIDRRLKMFYERKLTEIISLTPYGMDQNVVFNGAYQSALRTFIQRTKKYLPFVRYETYNEPNTNEDAKVEVNKKMVEILQSEGVPNWAIQIAFADRSANSAILINTLNSEGTMSLHWVGSMETIQDGPTPWAGSPGTQWLMGAGLGSSDDGQDMKRKSLGLNWGYLEEQGITEAQRPNNLQLYKMTRWMLRKFELMKIDANGNYIYTGQTVRGRVIEHLSAAGFQHKKEQPNLKMAIEIGRDERIIMRNAYNDSL